MNNQYMQQALELARAQLGQTWPNPSVGAVIVRDGKVVGIGVTAKGGRPHAEAIALAQAGEQARGATLYVTLEPCSHHGNTPPCTDAIIRGGLTHCIIACRDPHEEAGGGMEKLREAGIAVTLLESDEAREINRGFFSIVEKNRPYIALKLATSADGKIAASPGIRTDITCPATREHVMRMRAEFDAILTGIGTVLVDDPLMTVRIPGMEHRSPVRVVLDRNGRMPTTAKMLKNPDVPVWVLNQPLDEVIEVLTQNGITRLMVEAGQGVTNAFLASGLVDRICWYKAPHTLGAQGLDAVSNWDVLNDWQQVGDVVTIGSDKLTILGPTNK